VCPRRPGPQRRQQCQSDAPVHWLGSAETRPSAPCPRPPRGQPPWCVPADPRTLTERRGRPASDGPIAHRITATLDAGATGILGSRQGRRWTRKAREPVVLGLPPPSSRLRSTPASGGTLRYSLGSYQPVSPRSQANAQRGEELSDPEPGFPKPPIAMNPGVPIAARIEPLGPGITRSATAPGMKAVGWCHLSMSAP
jgi:hypothetical protein